tara:strand:+ start:343 stop:1047 length:705 start_codon:yes stop_codon:yes gene_type:complete
MPKIIKTAKGTYTAASITVDGSGRVITASTGAAGGGALVFKQVNGGPASGTYTANAAATFAGMYAYSGGGGGGGAYQGGNSPGQWPSGGAGGVGAYGFVSVDVTAPFSKSFAVGGLGAGGGQGNPGQNGAAGGVTNVTDVFTFNGGGGGIGVTHNTGPGAAGADGNTSVTSPATVTALGGRTYASAGADTGNSTTAIAYGLGGTPGRNGPAGYQGTVGGPGTRGLLLILENTGS